MDSLSGAQRAIQQYPVTLEEGIARYREVIIKTCLSKIQVKVRGLAVTGRQKCSSSTHRQLWGAAKLQVATWVLFPL